MVVKMCRPAEHSAHAGCFNAKRIYRIMKFCKRILKLSALAMLMPGSSMGMGLNELGAKLAEVDCYVDSVTYEVLLPSLADPVVYTISLSSARAENDTLSPCKYMIKWQLPAPSGVSEGFSAYFDGTHFRFRDRRLQEYHYVESPEPFSPSGNTSRGVQRQVQFADLLPQFIGDNFRHMSSDSTYCTRVVSDTLVSGEKSVVVKGVRRISGVDASEYLYVLDAATLLPRRIEFENNPGQIGEQSIIVNYSMADTIGCRIGMEHLMAAYPDAFGKYRENTFSLANLPGRPLPRIVAPSVTGERFEYEQGQGLDAPTVFVFLDATVGSTAQVIDDVRKGVDILPFRTDVVWAFLNHRADDVEGLVEGRRPGEHLLINAAGAARNCGVGNTTPAIVFATPAGIVSDIQVGYNQELPSIVIQKTTNSKFSK